MGGGETAAVCHTSDTQLCVCVCARVVSHRTHIDCNPHSALCLPLVLLDTAST